jgi:hypothetical protein
MDMSWLYSSPKLQTQNYFVMSVLSPRIVIVMTCMMDKIQNVISYQIKITLHTDCSYEIQIGIFAICETCRKYRQTNDKARPTSTSRNRLEPPRPVCASWQRPILCVGSCSSGVTMASWLYAVYLIWSDWRIFSKQCSIGISRCCTKTTWKWSQTVFQSYSSTVGCQQITETTGRTVQKVFANWKYLMRYHVAKDSPYTKTHNGHPSTERRQ